MVIKYPRVGGLGINNYLDSTPCFVDVNGISVYKVAKHFTNLEETSYDAECDTLRGTCLTQITGLVTTNSYTKAQTDGFINALTLGVTDTLTGVTPSNPSVNNYRYLAVPSNYALVIRDSTKTDVIVNFCDTGAVFYKAMTLTGTAVRQGWGAPCTKSEVDSVVNPLLTALTRGTTRYLNIPSGDSLNIRDSLTNNKYYDNYKDI